MSSFGPRAGSEADRTPPAREVVDLADAARMAHEFFVDGLLGGRDMARREISEELRQQLTDAEIAAGLLSQNQVIRARMDTAQEVAAYGPGGREHFGDPRPGDFPGRAAQQEAEQEAEAG